jgi:hypothetical protein
LAAATPALTREVHGVIRYRLLAVTTALAILVVALVLVAVGMQLAKAVALAATCAVFAAVWWLREGASRS